MLAMLPQPEIVMDTPVLSTLYAAATESLVSDASATSTFEKMITEAFTHGTIDTFTKDLLDTEKLIKKDFEVKSMPGPWRSAKSVITSAMKLNIKLVDSNGGYFGKTALQNKIKQTKVDTKEPINSDDYANKIIKLLMEIPEDLDSGLIFRLVNDFITDAD
jgi:hypothetical protein